MKPYYITTPIYYVNDMPHIGHAYTTIACDVLARFKRLDGFDVKFLTGTDEHGQKVEKAAANAQIAPQDLVDKVATRFIDLSKSLKSSHDDFIRTTQERHKQAVRHMWSILVKNKAIYLGHYEGWYSVRDEAFYQESELVNGLAPTGAPVEWVREPSYFFNLSQWQQPLLDFFERNPNFIEPASRFNEVKRFVESGLNDLSISRTSFSWGIPVPGDEKHVIYVWLDALTNYMSALGFGADETQLKQYWPESIHVIGKDILRFHGVFWPAFLMAAGLQPPKKVFAHGWWTNEGQKISKSVGNVIDPFGLIETFGLDAVRYFLMREVPFGSDGDFSKDALIGRLNSDLANAWGNLVQRVLSFIGKSCDGVLPAPKQLTPADRELIELPRAVLDKVRDCADKLAIHKMCEEIWVIIGRANKYMDDEKPWSLKKTDPQRMEECLYVLADVIRQIAILTQPILIDGSEKILDIMAIDPKERNFASLNNHLPSNHKIAMPEPIYPRYAAE